MFQPCLLAEQPPGLEAQNQREDDPGAALEVLKLVDRADEAEDYAAKVKAYEEAVQLAERTLHPDDSTTGIVHGGFGTMLWAHGDLAAAEPHLRRYCEVAKKQEGDEFGQAIALWQLGTFYTSIRDLPRAYEALREALQLARRTFPRNWKMHGILTSLEEVSAAQGKSDAVALAEEAVAFFEAFPSDHPTIIGMLPSHAEILQRLNRLPEARRAMERFLQLSATTFGPESPPMAEAHSTYGFLCVRENRFTEGAEHLERAIAIARKLNALAQTESLAARWLATARLGLNDPEAARLAARSAQEATEKFLANVLSFTSEEQRLALGRHQFPKDMLATIGDAEGLARSLLRSKGIVLDSVLEDRAVTAEANLKGQAGPLRELQVLKRQLFESSGTSPAQAGPAALQEKIHRLESSMARSLSAHGRTRRALEVKTEEIQAVIPSNTSLVEFVRYNHELSPTQDEKRYGAIIISNTDQPRWIALGSAAEIERELQLYRKSVRGLTDQATLMHSLRDVYDRVWAPVAAALKPDITSVVLTPDGELNFVSFATLLASENRFLCENYSLRYVASGRDLLRPTTAPKDPGLVVFANPAFARDPAAPSRAKARVAALPELGTRELVGVNLASLPGTSDEAAALLKRSRTNKAHVQVFTGRDATEKRLQQVTRPRILHLATHGFFLPEITLANADRVASTAGLPPATLVNPMHRSGLALAGAQKTLGSWQRGQIPPSENDGIVTAEEVGSMNLNGTWLVVLSACDTGSGEARAGEGVMGLRRGFVQAGAQNLLMTLWPISDETTVQIMLDFYDAAEKTKNAPQALADVQRDWLVKLRKERGLQAAVQLAGPFIMSSQGQP